MKFGVRQCANIVFRAKQPIRIGTSTFQAGQPVLYIDTATTSSMEQSTTTVYAQGGRGNVRLLSWEGEKTLTFSFTDALLSPVGFAILSGAGLFKRGDGVNSTKETNLGEDLVHFHMTSGATLEYNPTTKEARIDLRDAIAEFGSVASLSLDDAPVYIMETEKDGSLTGSLYTGTFRNLDSSVTSRTGIIELKDVKKDGIPITRSASVMVDYYVDLPGRHVYEADISPDTFGGNYYVEADTLFRDQNTGKDLPANLTFPNVRLQSSFTMTFAGSGDPSTFDFTMDAFPGYTYFDKKKKVLCALQVVDLIGIDEAQTEKAEDPVMYHDDVRQDADAFLNDSKVTGDERGAQVKYFRAKTVIDNRDGSSESLAIEIRLLNLKDSAKLKNYIEILDENMEDISSQVKPTYEIKSGNNGFITVDLNDGYIVAEKANPGSPVIMTASVETGDPDASETKALYFQIFVDPVAEG